MRELPTGYSGKLLCSIDCTDDFPAERYFENGATAVVESPVGRYREACDEPLTRFGYRFKIKNTGNPHMAVISYPDDKRRYMCVNDGTCYDLTTGVFTGGVYPVSNKMQRIENIFWPRWQDCSIVFMTWGYGEPAAVEGFSVYELDSLPAAKIQGSGQAGRRAIGVQYEDPCGKGASEGTKTFDEWLERHITYLHHTGQNILVYPINWYHGPQFPCKTQPADAFDVVVAEDRKQYSRSTTHPPDWPAVLLARFEKENLAFTGSMTLLRLGNLLKDMNIDLDAIKAGKETYNNLLWNDEVQSSCGDWTAIYNARNYKENVRWQEEKRDMSDFPFAYGEKRGKFHGGPMFNPLHPEVQRQILAYIEEIGARYGKYKAFKGISINVWHATLIWFGSLHAGYDDYTAALFEKETGISTGIKPDDPNRFSKRYEFLTFKCRPAWVDWRCAKIRDFVCAIRDALRRGNPELTLSLNFWNETSKPQIFGGPNAQSQYGARVNDYDFFKEGGADLMLLGKEDGIEISVETNHQRDRGWDTKGVNAPLEAGFMFRDHDFLDTARHDALRNANTPDAFVFNCWVEAWGEHKWFSCEPGDPNLPEVTKMYDGEAEYVHRMNSYYPADGFWWDSQLRITSAFPPAFHFKEHYVHALAEYDALSITRGGLYLDKAHSIETLEFAKAYRVLPDKKFETVGETTDPVAVRKLIYDNKLYFYIVNREPYEIAVKVKFNKEKVTLTDMSDSSVTEGLGTTEFKLLPYDLKVFTANDSTDITGFFVSVPDEITAELSVQAERTMKAFETVKDSGFSIPGMEKMEADILQSMEQKRYSRLRHELTSYISCKALKIQEESVTDL